VGEARDFKFGVHIDNDNLASTSVRMIVYSQLVTWLL